MKCVRRSRQTDIHAPRIFTTLFSLSPLALPQSYTQFIHFDGTVLRSADLLYERVLAGFQSHGEQSRLPRTRLALSDMRCRLAIVYERQGRLKRALPVTERAVNEIRQLASEAAESGHADDENVYKMRLAEYLNSLGRVYSELRMVDPAVQSLQEALDILLGLRDTGVAVEEKMIARTRYNLGRTITIGGENVPSWITPERVNRAIAELERALAVHESLWTPKDREWVFVGSNKVFLGKALGLRGDSFEDTFKPFFIAGLEIQKSLLPATHQNLALTRMDAARHCLHCGVHEKAEDLLNKAIDVLKHAVDEANYTPAKLAEAVLLLVEAMEKSRGTDTGDPASEGDPAPAATRGAQEKKKKKNKKKNGGILSMFGFGKRRRAPSVPDPGIEPNSSRVATPEIEEAVDSIRRRLDEEIAWFKDHVVEANHREAHKKLGKVDVGELLATLETRRGAVQVADRAPLSWDELSRIRV